MRVPVTLLVAFLVLATARLAVARQYVIDVRANADDVALLLQPDFMSGTPRVVAGPIDGTLTSAPAVRPAWRADLDAYRRPLALVGSIAQPSVFWQTMSGLDTGNTHVAEPSVVGLDVTGPRDTHVKDTTASGLSVNTVGPGQYEPAMVWWQDRRSAIVTVDDGGAVTATKLRSSEFTATSAHTWAPGQLVAGGSAGSRYAIRSAGHVFPVGRKLRHSGWGVSIAGDAERGGVAAFGVDGHAYMTVLDRRGRPVQTTVVGSGYDESLDPLGRLADGTAVALLEWTDEKTRSSVYALLHWKPGQRRPHRHDLGPVANGLSYVPDGMLQRSGRLWILNGSTLTTGSAASARMRQVPLAGSSVGAILAGSPAHLLLRDEDRFGLMTLNDDGAASTTPLAVPPM